MMLKMKQLNALIDDVRIIGNSRCHFDWFLWREKKRKRRGVYFCGKDSWYLSKCKSWHFITIDLNLDIQLQYEHQDSHSNVDKLFYDF